MKRSNIRNIVLAIILSIAMYSGYISIKYYNTINVKEESECFTTPIVFDFSNITDIIYNAETNLSYIKYNDLDAFDYDNLAYHCNMDEWYGEYIICNIDSNIAVQFNKDNVDFNNTSDYYEKKKLNKKYIIIETECNSDITWEVKDYNYLK